MVPSSAYVTSQHGFNCWSYLKVVPEDALWQSEIDLMVATKHLPALAPKAPGVDHTCSQLAC